MEFASHHSGAAHSDTDYNWFKERKCASCEVNLDMVYSSGLCFKRNVQEICNSVKDDANFYCMHDFESSKSAWMHPLVLSFTSIQSLRILGPTKAALLSAMCVQPLNWDVAFMLSCSLLCPAKWTHPAKIVDFFLWRKKLAAKSGNKMKIYRTRPHVSA